MKKIKGLLCVVLTLSMMVGSMSMVFAGGNSASVDFGDTGCSANYDAYCSSTGGTASTWMYITGNPSYYEASVSMKLYYIPADCVGLSPNLYDNVKELWGSDSDSSTYSNSGLVTADAEVAVGTGHYIYSVESDHEAKLTHNSQNYSNSHEFEVKR